MVAHARFHRRSDTQRLMNPAEVVKHEIERQRVLVVFYLFRESVRQSRKPPHGPSHRQILALREACGNVPVIWIATDDGLASAHAHSWAVARRFLENIECSLSEIALRFTLLRLGFGFWHPRPSHESR